MADKLVVIEEKYLYYIVWELDNGDDLGAYLCQDKEDGTGDPPQDRSDWEHWAACQAVRGTEGVAYDFKGAYWETQKQATAALRVAKAALKQDRPLPDWAKTALAAGWTAPKGWKA